MPGAAEVLPKSPLRSPERYDRAAFEDRSGGERSTERGRGAKTVASQPWIGYPSCARTAKTEILVKVTQADRRFVRHLRVRFFRKRKYSHAKAKWNQ